MTVRSKIKYFLAPAALLIALLIPLGAMFVWTYVSETFANNSALWNTTDAISHFVGENDRWPSDWESLSSSLAFVDPSKPTNNSRAARVDINFEIDLGWLPQPDDWYVRLKGNQLPGEERSANERLRNYISGRHLASKPSKR